MKLKVTLIRGESDWVVLTNEDKAYVIRMPQYQVLPVRDIGLMIRAGYIREATPAQDVEEKLIEAIKAYEASQ